MKTALKIFFCILFFPVLLFAQKAEENEGKNPKKEKRVNTVIIPTITYNNSFGAIFGAMASGFYRMQKNDSISPLSKTMLIANYSTNKTWYVVQPNRFYFKENIYRGKLVSGLGSVNFQTYLEWGDLFPNLPNGILPIPGDEGEFVNYNNKFQFVFLEFLGRVYGQLYVGGRILFSHAYTTFDTNLKPDEEVIQIGFGVSSEYDIRDNQFQPTKGINAKLSTNSFFESLGSTDTYTNINYEVNKYLDLKGKNTLLIRAYGQIATGNVPFSGQNVVGQDDLRGYSNGKHRANQVYDAQTEYRHWFKPRWGYVAFGGVATAINGLNDLNSDNILPAIGAGIRYLAIPKANINVGIDLAVGREDWGVYFRIGEAFTR
ncbi:BamA/TamA family outer membrane protein [Tamlana sp. I1]|uniref:BamA/TamA family outer membrane protein n=1 Tax=Tamlana sp. I1 TaxID=2762061 RepID=UPI00188F123C|nr:BamA/TamA family outer membrane protein [Tamlana sp. I1]